MPVCPDLWLAIACSPASCLATAVASRLAVVQAKRATAEDLQQYPARLALADAMKHVLWVAENYDALDREFPNHPWNAVMVGAPDKPQNCLLLCSFGCCRPLISLY